MSIKVPYPDDDHDWYDCESYGILFDDYTYIKCKKCSHIIFTVSTTFPYKFYNSDNSCFKVTHYASIPSCKELIMRRALT